MGRTLNAITDEQAQYQLDVIPPSLQKRELVDVARLTDRQLLGHTSAMREMQATLAVSMYQLEHPTEQIIGHLRAAAHWTGEEYRARARSGITYEQVWTLFLDDLGLVTAFGDTAARQALGSAAVALTLRRNHGHDVALLWKTHLDGGPLSAPALQGVIDHCRRPEADPWDSGWTLGIAGALLGICRSDEAVLDVGLTQVVAYTRRLARRGGWKRLSNGQLSLVGLGLCALARDAGLPLHVDSPYIPTSLVVDVS